jgi:hypothetical protein
MECLKSFSLSLSGNISGTGTQFWAWGPITDYNWNYESNGLSSTFNIQGFKNINIHKIEQLGYFNSARSSNSVIINDWSFFVRINGQNPVLPGFISATNDFGLTQQLTPLIALGKYNNSIEFISPISSVSSLVVEKFEANGTGSNSGSAALIEWSVTINVYYSFEGEDY